MKVAYNLRFPGQYYDAETGLSQNWNRDYDPLTGRYIELMGSGCLGEAGRLIYTLLGTRSFISIPWDCVGSTFDQPGD